TGGGGGTGGGAGDGSNSPTQPNQEGIPRQRPYVVMAQVIPPVTTTARSLVNTNADAPQEIYIPPDPFPGEKPNVVVKTLKPDANYAAEATDSLGRKTIYYY